MKPVLQSTTKIAGAARAAVSSKFFVICGPDCLNIGWPAILNWATLPAREMNRRVSRIWRGTAFGGARGRTDVPKIVDWYIQGKIQIDPMITHVMPLGEINNAFELMMRGESIRGVVTF